MRSSNGELLAELKSRKVDFVILKTTFGRTILNGPGKIITLSDVTQATRLNIESLEQRGYRFGNIGKAFFVLQRCSFARACGCPFHTTSTGKVKVRIAKTLCFTGLGPNKEVVHYVRREFSHPSAGQTFLYVDDVRYKLALLLTRR